MDRSIRISAKTVDDAITEALVQLKVTSDRLDYEVIEQGSPGFLGIGMKQAVIEARVKPSSFEKDKTEKPAYQKTEKPTYTKTEKSTYTKKESSVEQNTSSNVVKEPTNYGTKETTTKQVINKSDKEVEAPKREVLAEVTPEAISAVDTFLKDTLEAIGLEVTITSSIDQDGALYIDLAGQDMGVLIGKRGQTLDALQYLANRVANKQQEEYVRVKLDIEDYRNRREETLTRLAKNLASKVKRSRRATSLEPMNPYERRIIHSVLQDDPQVTTHSEGEEPYRKVVITYKKSGYQRRY